MSGKAAAMMNVYGGPQLVDYFREAAAVEYRANSSVVEPLKFTAIVSSITFAEVLSDVGISRRETRTMRIDAALLAQAGITGYQSQAVVTINGEPWQCDEGSTVWGQVFVTLGLVRQPLIRKGNQAHVV